MIRRDDSPGATIKAREAQLWSQMSNSSLLVGEGRVDATIINNAAKHPLKGADRVVGSSYHLIYPMLNEPPPVRIHPSLSKEGNSHLQHCVANREHWGAAGRICLASRRSTAWTFDLHFGRLLGTRRLRLLPF